MKETTPLPQIMSMSHLLVQADTIYRQVKRIQMLLVVLREKCKDGVYERNNLLTQPLLYK